MQQKSYAANTHITYLAASKVVPIVNILKTDLQAFETSIDVGHYFKKVLKDQFIKQFENIEQVSLLAIATILDPRFKNILFIYSRSHSILG